MNMNVVVNRCYRLAEESESVRVGPTFQITNLSHHERLQTRVARATGPYRPATRRTERVRRSFCQRTPFPTVRPAPLNRVGSPAGRASGPFHPSLVHAFAIWRFRAALPLPSLAPASIFLCPRLRFYG